MQNQTSNVASHEVTIGSLTISIPVQLACAFLLGAIIMYGVGFLNIGAVHNAAHDARHSQGFPCH